MLTVLNLIVLGAGILLLVPTFVLFAEVLLGLTFVQRLRDIQSDGRATILIPAHNEVPGIARTIENLKTQVGPGDKILVVADNCTDGTAGLVRSSGAEVAERIDSSNRGKGFALAFGIEVMRTDPPDVVIVSDADCVFAPGAIAALKAKALKEGRPVQALYLMQAPKGLEHRFAVAEFAWRIRNHLRPLGLSRLGLPCQLMGTGMAFPWDLARTNPFASGNIVEDLELGLKMARFGRAALLFTGATVFSEFPSSMAGEISQRRRWEGGSFSMLLRHGIKNAVRGVMRGNLDLTALGFDMLVPPLVIHGLAISGYLVLAAILSLFAGSGPLTLALLAVCLFGVSMVLAWWRVGRDVLPLRLWGKLLPFVLAKFRIHKSTASEGKQGWVRTDRGNDGGK
jgi:cellulose synthase/poly-beta-1,6-N-acetylglucosamine synthase-like glycosyltransferase